MKTHALLFLITIFLLSIPTSCKKSPTEPPIEINLLENSTFELNGAPSLHGWVVRDSSVVQFSEDLPTSGYGRSIVFKSMGRAPWLSNSIYAIVPAQLGTNRYRISVFGKTRGAKGGGVYVGKNINSSGKGTYCSSLSVEDTVWTLYSKIDTITTDANDTLFVIISGASSCTELILSYFNNCKFVRLK